MLNEIYEVTVLGHMPLRRMTACSRNTAKLSGECVFKSANSSKDSHICSKHIPKGQKCAQVEQAIVVKKEKKKTSVISVTLSTIAF